MNIDSLKDLSINQEIKAYEGQGKTRTGAAAEDQQAAISNVKNDWKVQVRNLDIETRTLQGTISRHQMIQDTLISIQTELIGHDESTPEQTIRNVNRIIDNARFNEDPVLERFRLQDPSFIYEYTAIIEAEKNQVFEQITDLSSQIKTNLIAKENLVIAGGGMDRIDFSNEIFTEVKDYLNTLNNSSNLDNSRIKDLLG